MVELINSGQAISDRIVSAIDTRTQATPYEIGYRVGILSAGAIAGGLMLMLVASEPALAQANSSLSTGGGSSICDTALMDFVAAVTGGITVLGPTLGIANAGWNMSKAASTNKSQKKKEAKENVRSSLMYGIGAGMLTAIAGLITTWGPISFC